MLPPSSEDSACVSQALYSAALLKFVDMLQSWYDMAILCCLALLLILHTVLYSLQVSEERDDRVPEEVM